MFGARIKEDELRLYPSRRKDLYQSIIRKVFSPMRLGRLEMVLPDGEIMAFGQGGGVEASLTIKNRDFFKRCVLYGDIGFGESYVEGDWSSDDVTKVVQWMILNAENHPILMADTKKMHKSNLLGMFNNIAHALRENSLLGSRKNIQAHYDLGNEFFKLFLDPTMMYSSAYFQHNDQSLPEAQAVKCDKLCQKLQLKESDHLLEIGSGWGGFAIHAAENYGCKVTTTTISSQQYEYAKKRIQEAGLDQKVNIVLQDYRLLKGHYDKIVSIEMIEAVGHNFLEAYFRKCHELLKPHGLLGLQMILSPDHRYESFRRNVDWIQKYIFPGSLLPSVGIIQEKISKAGTLNLYHFEDMTSSYAKTLAVWREGFNHNIDKIRAMGFDEPFIRKWNYYWCYCEAAFAMRNISVAQAVFSRPNNLTLS